MSSRKTQGLRVGGFSTNMESFSPIGIIDRFFTGTKCDNISYIKNNHVEFDYSLPNSSKCHLNYIEIPNLNKTYNICSCADCFVIFADLEQKNTLEKLEPIFNYIKENCTIEKKIYVIGVFTKIENISDELKEQIIKDFLDSTKFIYEYITVNLELSVDLIKRIEKIMQEEVENKRYSIKVMEKGGNDLSNSGCFVW